MILIPLLRNFLDLEAKVITGDRHDHPKYILGWQTRALGRDRVGFRGLKIMGVGSRQVELAGNNSC